MGPCQSKPPKGDEMKMNNGTSQGKQNTGPNPATKSAGKKDIHFSHQNFVHENSGKLSDSYDILSPPLGSGAYGEVRKAKFKKTGEIRAVKIISKSAQSPEEQEKLINEVQILKSLDHPNIIKIFEFYQDERSFYIVTELCTGGELFDKIIESKNFNEQKAADIIRDVLSAVAYCHDNRIVHRDLKPENLLLENNTSEARIKVIDFGLSKVYDPSKKLRHKLGTVYYIAPEVLKMQYDEKCDVWSCGVITYILLSGFPPFNAQKDEQIIKKIEKGEFSFSARVWQNVSDRAKGFIRRMLEYEPTSRYSARQALDDPWLKEHDRRDSQAFSQPSLNDAFSQLKSFRAESKLAQATYVFIVSYLTTKEEREELIKLFKQLDRNSDGVLSREELSDGFKKYYGGQYAETMVNEIMAHIDTNKSDRIDYSGL
eukprot:TRINITY_DN10426_c0_g1_i7.p1 TRINITY_DN10426_c0_g1~~TRINITY_DN10426_c0_g1_i7.p1  ORF type:complete len:428 (-),score=113.13 TRINITY_DN10426_c0_g1_i7:461-1744(-)